MLNIFSIKNEPVTISVMLLPKEVAMGIRLLRSAWRTPAAPKVHALGDGRAHVLRGQIVHQRVLHQERGHRETAGHVREQRQHGVACYVAGFFEAR